MQKQRPFPGFCFHAAGEAHAIQHLLDNLKVHHAKVVKAWLDDHQNDIEVFCLLPYSPELTPDE